MGKEKALSKENGVVRVFNSEEFGSLRIIEIDGESWFVGREIADILGYGNGNNKSKSLSNAIVDHVDEDDKRHISYEEFKGYQNGDLKNISHYGMVIINESGLYSLILSSKLPSAKKFKHWVTSEILPSIRKHGAYMTDETLKKAILDPDFLIQLATTLKEEQTKNKQLKEENEKLSETNKLLADDVLTWTNRNNVNAIVRKLSKVLSLQFGYMFNCIYKELFYKYGIALKNRASVAESKGGEKQSLLSYIREDEWSKVEAVISAICEKNGIDTESFFKEATNQAIKQPSPV